MAKRRSYTDVERAEALAALDANGGDEALTARQLGVPRTTIQEWAKGRVSRDVPELRQEKKEGLADRLEAVAHQLLSLFPDKAKDANLQQVATSFGIAIDKMRLLREQPTNITGDGISDAERVARFRALVEQFRRETSGNGSAHHGCEAAAVDAVPGQGRSAKPATPSV